MRDVFRAVSRVDQSPSTREHMKEDDDYDAERDFSESINEAYRVIRERVTNGGVPWIPRIDELRSTSMGEAKRRKLIEEQKKSGDSGPAAGDDIGSGAAQGHPHTVAAAARESRPRMR
jgi:hypothetical protein